MKDTTLPTRRFLPCALLSTKINVVYYNFVLIESSRPILSLPKKSQRKSLRHASYSKLRHFKQRPLPISPQGRSTDFTSPLGRRILGTLAVI